PLNLFSRSRLSRSPGLFPSCAVPVNSMDSKYPIVIALDGTSASGKSTNAKLIAKKLGFVYVDTGAMYRTLAWYCLRNQIDTEDAKAIANACRRWKTHLQCIDHVV